MRFGAFNLVVGPAGARHQLSWVIPSLPWHSRLLLLGLDPAMAACPSFGVQLQAWVSPNGINR